jgi:NADH-quinone oxidoreductase subunit J
MIYAANNMTVFLMISIFIFISSCMVIKARNPVNSVLYLILVFIMTAGIFILVNADFIGIIIIVVYVGAIAVLFLFVVMLLNIRTVELSTDYYTYLPISMIIGVLFIIEMIWMYATFYTNNNGMATFKTWVLIKNWALNINVLGGVLYTYFAYMFIIGGCILLLALICTIVLTFQERINIKKQIVAVQIHNQYLSKVVNSKHCPGMESNQRHRDFQSLALPLSYLNIK